MQDEDQKRVKLEVKALFQIRCTELTGKFSEYMNKYEDSKVLFTIREFEDTSILYDVVWRSGDDDISTAKLFSLRIQLRPSPDGQADDYYYVQTQNITFPIYAERISTSGSLVLLILDAMYAEGLML